MMVPFVSIIVPVKNEYRYITACIASLLELDYPKNRREIIIVTDKNVTEGVRKALKTYKGMVKVLRSSKAGAAANRNLGVSKASSKAKYLAFTDADCVAEKKWIRTLVERMEQVQKDEKDIGVIGGLNLVPKSDNKLAKTIGAMEQTLIGGGGSAQVAIVREEQIVPSLPTCNAMYRRELWKKEKQDESLMVGQDGELNYRLAKKGVRFLATPDAIVWHHRTNSLKGFIRRMFKYGEATAKIFRKHPEKEFISTRWYGFMPSAALVVLVGLIIASFYSIGALMSLAFILGMYAAADIMTAISVMQRTRLAYSMTSLFLLPMQHFLYAAGFLKGILKQ